MKEQGWLRMENNNQTINDELKLVEAKLFKVRKPLQHFNVRVEIRGKLLHLLFCNYSI